jgi:hypothetical protein
VIDTLVTSTALQGGVGELRPAFARVLHPLATVKRAALVCTAALGCAEFARRNHCWQLRSIPSFPRSEIIRCACGLCSWPSASWPA